MSFSIAKYREVLHSEYGMLKERQAVAIPVQEHGQIVIDICLCKIVRELLKIQYRLRNLQAVGVDRTVRILCETQFFSKQRTDAKPSAIQACLVMAEVRRRKTKLNAFLKFGNSFNRLVQVCIGHGVLWCRVLYRVCEEGPNSPCTFNKNGKECKILVGRWSRMALAFSPQ